MLKTRSSSSAQGIRVGAFATEGGTYRPAPAALAESESRGRPNRPPSPNEIELERVVGSVSFGNCGNAMGNGAGERNEAVKKPETTDFKKNGCVPEGKV